LYAIETMKQSFVQRLSPQLRIERDEYKHLRKTDRHTHTSSAHLRAVRLRRYRHGFARWR
jgi:hypothetical protein